MLILSSIKKSFNDIIHHTSITLFFVLFLIVFNFIGAYAVHATKIEAVITFFITMVLVAVCFMSGWFYLVKKVAGNETSGNPFSVFLEGIGKNIISVTLGMFFYTIFMYIAFFLAGKFAFHIFGSLNFLSEETLPMFQNAQAYGEYFKSLSSEQQLTLNGWFYSILIATTLSNFLFTFFTPGLVKETTSCEDKKKIILLTIAKPFLALADSLKLIFKNFLDIILGYLIIGVIYFVLGYLNLVLGQNQFLSLLILFFYIYFLTFVIMLIFNYYETKNNSDNGCNSIGENKSCNSAGESN